MITDIEDFFTKGCGRCERFATSDCSIRRWAAVLADLRRLCQEAGLTETLKWGHACYMHAGQNVAILGAFRDNARLTFLNAAPMRDPEGVLQRQGPNTRHPDMIRFSDPAGVRPRERLVLSYLEEAMSYAAAGLRPQREVRDDPLPDELVETLDDDPELAEAFWRLTPGRRNSYAIHLSNAKAPVTRRARIARFRGRILAGKGATER
jgi:uncharacterized protein YdeI (YjbR/CyaY-like superfamily)